MRTAGYSIEPQNRTTFFTVRRVLPPNPLIQPRHQIDKPHHIRRRELATHLQIGDQWIHLELRQVITIELLPDDGLSSMRIRAEGFRPTPPVYEPSHSVVRMRLLYCLNTTMTFQSTKVDEQTRSRGPLMVSTPNHRFAHSQRPPRSKCFCCEALYLGRVANWQPLCLLTRRRPQSRPAKPSDWASPLLPSLRFDPMRQLHLMILMAYKPIMPLLP